MGLLRPRRASPGPGAWLRLARAPGMPDTQPAAGPPERERAGVVLHALYSPHRPGERGAALAPGPAASAASQLGARRS